MTDSESSISSDNPNASNFVPVSIDRDGDSAIVIKWSDGAETRWTVSRLREICPCATCREKRKSGQSEEAEPSKPAMLPILSASEARPLRIEGMQPVGSYAYSIAFSDGHSSGIFKFALLHGDEPEINDSM